MAKKLTDVVTDARDAGTPLVAVATADQIAAMAAICEATNGAAKVAWDAARGVRGINPAGQAFVKSCGAPEEIAQNSTNPQTALEIADKLPEDGIFFMVSAHRFVEDAFVSTGRVLRNPLEYLFSLFQILKSSGFSNEIVRKPESGNKPGIPVGRGHFPLLIIPLSNSLALPRAFDLFPLCAALPFC